MSEKYKIRDNDKAYFITITVVGWLDVFTRPNHKQLIINSLQYCAKNKGLVIFAWCLMSNHLHMICRSEGHNTLSDILRDFKTFTSKKIIEQIKEEPESRREQMLEYFANACAHLKGNQKYKVWQDGNHPVELLSTSFIYEKLEYIHNNLVEELIVEKPQEYLYSSARNYADMEGFVDVFVIGHRPLVDNWRQLDLKHGQHVRASWIILGFMIARCPLIIIYPVRANLAQRNSCVRFSQLKEQKQQKQKQ